MGKTVQKYCKGNLAKNQTPNLGINIVSIFCSMLHFANKQLHSYIKKHKSIQQEKNKTYSILNPTLKQLIIGFH